MLLEILVLYGLGQNICLILDECLNFYEQMDKLKIQVLFVICVDYGIFYDEEFQVFNISGQFFWVCVLGELVFDGVGKVVCVDGVFQDVSE